MSSTELVVPTIVPDSIEAVEAFRCWVLVGDELKSLNGELSLDRRGDSAVADRA